MNVYHGKSIEKKKKKNTIQLSCYFIDEKLIIFSGASTVFGVRYPQLDFSTNFLKLLQFTLIAHYYWSIITRSRHRDDILQHVVNPILCLFMLYCTIVVLMGMVDTSGTWVECIRPYWLMLSIADLIAVQLFSLVSLYITHYSYHKHHNHTKSNNNRKNIIINSKSRDLWIVTFVYQLSAIVSVLFDSIMVIFCNNENGCSAIYQHKQIYYSFVNFLFMIIKFFLPIWILLWLFKPIRVKSRPSEVALTSHYNNIDGNYYRQIFFNGDDNNTQVRNDNSTINYPIEQSSIYGSFVDFSCTDSSSSDLSPTTNYWSTNKDDKHFGNNDNCEINNINYCIDENSHKYDNNIQIGIQENKKKHLTTINEESGGIMMENLYD